MIYRSHIVLLAGAVLTLATIAPSPPARATDLGDEILADEAMQQAADIAFFAAVQRRDALDLQRQQTDIARQRLDLERQRARLRR
jgi:hypothetical protein